MIFKPAQREFDKPYMGAIAKLPCLACLCHAKIKWGVHVAHLRAGSLAYDKPYTAKGRKPSDRWTLPLCPPHHTGDKSRIRISQHEMDEESFWLLHGIADIFAVCLDLGRAYDLGQPLYTVLAHHASLAQKARTA